MIDQLGFGHLQSRVHPTQEFQVRSEVQIHELAHKRASPPRAAPQALEVPFREVDSVINRLNPKNGEGQKEGKCAEDVDGGCHRYIVKRGHGWDSSTGRLALDFLKVANDIQTNTMKSFQTHQNSNFLVPFLLLLPPESHRRATERKSTLTSWLALDL